MTPSSNFVIVDRLDYFLLFDNPIHELETYDLENVFSNLVEVDKFVKSGFYVAGFLSYEAGGAFFKFEENTNKKPNNLPLLWFGIFRKPKIIEIPKPTQNYRIYNLKPNITFQEYSESIDKIKYYIREGYTYQVNFTFKVKFSFEGDPFEMFLNLRKLQPSKNSRFVKYNDVFILSHSPELFFKTKNNQIETKPMKGTISRGRTYEEDKKRIKELFFSEKDRAENVMIVDLMRNDLGIISEFGSVKVKDLFKIEKYPTVFQMVSTIKSTLKRNMEFSEIIKETFPGGSITGAPKKKTIEIISKLEKEPREIYTGSIGFITPKGYSEFNIAIRSPVILGNKGEMGIGSGITWDSETEKEYNESLLKSNFLISKPKDEFKLIETMLLRNGKIYLLKYHLERLIKSAKYFDFKLPKNLKTQLQKLENDNKIGKFKVRLLLGKDGKIEIEKTSLEKTPRIGYISIAKEKVRSDDIFLYHKTTKRELYNKYLELAKSNGLVDFIFTNEKGEITEGCIHNIILKIGDELITPFRYSGLLRGIMLKYLKIKYKIKEKVIYLEELKKADKIYLCNSVTGIKLVRLQS